MIVDEGWLVWVAASANDEDPRRVLAEADVAALAAVVTDAAAVVCRDPWTTAAAALAAIVRRRPFRSGNDAAAWLATVMILSESGLSPRQTADGVVRLLESARADVALAQLAAALEMARAWKCPACGRPIRAYERAVMPNGPLLVGTSRYELTARCWYEHRAHDRRGQAITTARSTGSDDGWRPIVTDERSGGVLVLIDGGAIALAPVDQDYSATALHDLQPGDLAGDWDRLRLTGDPLGRVPLSAVRFDGSRRNIDWPHLQQALDNALVPA